MGVSMAVQQLLVYRVTPGRRDELLGLLKQVQANIAKAGAVGRVGVVTSGQNFGAIGTVREHESWEALADYNEQHGNTAAMPLLEAMRSASPPATPVVAGIRSEVDPEGHGPSDKPFVSGISFDVLSDRPAVVKAVGETRDMFESLGSDSRIWVSANGENSGRITITSQFDNLAGWARFRAALEARTEGAPMMGVQGKFQSAGILHWTEIEL
jgi:hypothetical protein